MCTATTENYRATDSKRKLVGRCMHFLVALNIVDKIVVVETSLIL